jgi:uncharacterized radical SAM protein YgiQ
VPFPAALGQPEFLPVSREEMDALGWNELDILLVSGDAYIDHPSFGTALLGRYLVAHGYRVGIVAQPRWQGDEALHDVVALGRPRLFAGVSAGAIDSMFARYTAFRKQRSDDAYTPGGRGGSRPNRATIIYTNLLRRAFPGLPVVLGGIEASLRRASHYDFWTDSLRRSALLDAKADLLLYGMGERALLETAKAVEKALATAGDLSARAALAAQARHIRGTVYSVPQKDADHLLAETAVIRLPSHEAIEADSFLLVIATAALEKEVHQGSAVVVQDMGDRTVVMTPPAYLLTTEEMDALYALPYSRLPHPSYKEAIPAWEMIRTSITSHRGCGGGCAFCSLALHQTRHIASRSRESILTEACHIAGMKIKGKVPQWVGSISDVGGPSANMWEAACAANPEKCERASCLFPRRCPAFTVDQRKGAAMLRAVAAQKGVRHVRVASGVRFDLALEDANALAAYTQEFTGGQLKIAPEHMVERVLELMRKPSLEVFETFLQKFYRLSKEAGKEQYVILYLMSAYPGCTERDMQDLAAWLKKRNWSPRQVQCFIPMPGTVASAMYHSGKDPQGNAIVVAKTDAERIRQHYILLGKDDGASENRPRKKFSGHDTPKNFRDTRKNGEFRRHKKW